MICGSCATAILAVEGHPTLHEDRVKYMHHISLASFLSTIEPGCYICSRIYESFEQVDWDFLLETQQEVALLNCSNTRMALSS
jgi:hypothetical protein